MKKASLIPGFLLILNSTFPAFSADAARGKDIYMKAGCHQCHGTMGQGANTGPKLAPEPLPLESLIAFVRNAATTAMPAYSARLVSDAEMADIHAYLASMSRPPQRKDVPLLNNP
jgi:ubiquinol-cytochrome c reductase cytochrome c subunit